MTSALDVNQQKSNPTARQPLHLITGSKWLQATTTVRQQKVIYALIVKIKRYLLNWNLSLAK
jgi:hypothetical protein